MKTKICLNTWKRLTKLTAICALVLISSAFAGSMVVVQKLKHGSAAGTGQPNACSQTSQHALDSCRAGPQSEYTLTLASCDNIPNSAARQQSASGTPFTVEDLLEVRSLNDGELSDDGRWLAIQTASLRDRIGIDNYRFGDPTYISPTRAEVLIIDTQAGRAQGLFPDKRQVRV